MSANDENANDGKSLEGRSLEGSSLPPEIFGDDAVNLHRRSNDDDSDVLGVEDPLDPDDPDTPLGLHSRQDSEFLNAARAGSSFRKRRSLPTRRGLISLMLVALFIGGLVVDANHSESAPKVVPSPVAGAAPASATSSAWYCPLSTATRSNPNASSVVIFNPADRTLSGTATYFPQNGAPIEVPVNVPGRTRVALHPGESVDSSFAATLVRFDGGGAGVEQSIATPTGIAFAPCATQASAQWFFAEGSTQAGTTLTFGLFNPFQEDAIADVKFVTSDGGTVQPDEFQGVVIPARSFTSLNVSDRVRRRDWIATTVTVRSGRIVASELQTGPFNGVPGAGLTLGATSPRNTWFLPDGVNQPGFTDQLTLYNPNNRESEATVELLTDKGSITPFTLHVPAEGRIAVNLDKEERVPKDSAYGTVVRVINGVNVVVQRTATASNPYPTSGAFTQLADTDPAKRWIVPLSETRDPFDDWVYVMNSSGRNATVKVTGLSPNGQALVSTGTVQSGRRLLIHVDEFAADQSNPGLVIESDQPVVTGRTLYVNPGIGLNSSLMIPVR